MPNDRIKKVLDEYRTGLELIFGPKLRSVILFGSQARGEADVDSDIDVLCVLQGPFDYSEMISKTSELTATLSLKHDVVLSRVFVSDSDFKNRSLPFYMNVRKEGIAL